ncbi:MAG: alpha-glucan family phosphorylase [Planctomycetota bacterium]
MVAVTLLYRKGYFLQRIDALGRQREEPVAWTFDQWLQPTPARAEIEIEGRRVALRAWRLDVRGVTGGVVPVYLLDTDLPENAAADRALSDSLYGGDERYRLCQEILLGIGGVRILRSIGHGELDFFHMNEGHSALLALELCREQRARGLSLEEAVARVRRRCVFTTHTPVAAGHDRFPVALVEAVLGAGMVRALGEVHGLHEQTLHMTRLGLELSHYVNAVARRHGEVSRSLFPEYPIDSITNGVHSVFWTCPAFRELYDRYLPDWRRDSFAFRLATMIPLDAVRRAHLEAKRKLVQRVNETAGAGFEAEVLTLAFARRATAYKRPALLLHDPGRLRRITIEKGPLQIVFAGKSHPRDEAGKDLIQKILALQNGLRPEIKIAYLPNYDMEVAADLVAGVDVWVNNPRPPLEASGTSGMKAAHNGVPSLSILDGWWWEGWMQGATGWAIGSRDYRSSATRADEEDAFDLYWALEEEVMPLYYRNPARWAALMLSTIAINASFFNTQRMVLEYVAKAYR